MKINENENLNDVLSIGNFDTKEARIDTNNLGHIFTLVSSNLYSKPIESTVREITSNCFDAHIAANTDEAVVLKAGWDGEGYYIEFKDLGTGLTPEGMDKIFNSWFSSTKRESNDFIGAWGIGSKSPLSYTDSFFITTRVDGIEYKYMYSKGSKLPELDPLSSKPTNEPNGTIIKVPIKDYSDLVKFKKAVLTELKYFDNIYYEGDLAEFNEHRIYDGKTFKYSTSNNSNDFIHIALGNVSYPIDFSIFNGLDYEFSIDGGKKVKILDVLTFELPIAIKFQIGELSVTPSRENIQYNEDSAKLISDRIIEVVEELYSIYKKNEFKSTDNFFEWFINKDTKPFIKFDENVQLNVPFIYNTKTRSNNLFGHELNQLTYSEFDEIGIKPPNYGLDIFTIVDKVTNGKMGKLDKDIRLSFITHFITMVKKYKSDIIINNYDYVFNNVYRKRGNDKYNYLGLLYIDNGYILKVDNLKRYKYSDWCSIFGLDRFDYGNAKKIKAAKKWLFDFVVKITKSYDTMIIPQEFINANKIKRTSVNNIKEGKLRAYVYGLGTITKDIKDYVKHKKLIIYGGEEDKDILLKADFVLFNGLKEREFHSSFENNIIVRTSKSGCKILDSIPQAINVHDFMKGESRILKRLINSIYIRKELKERNGYLFSSSGRDIINEIKPDLYVDYDSLVNYNSNYYNSYFSDKDEIATEKALYRELKDKFLDSNIVDSVNKIKDTVDKLPLLSFIPFNEYSAYHKTRQRKELVYALIDYFKKSKIKIHSRHYIILSDIEKSWLNYNKEVYESYT